MSTIEYNATQTIAIRPSYVCTQPRTECPIPLQWTCIHPFIQLAGDHLDVMLVLRLQRVTVAKPAWLCQYEKGLRAVLVTE